jgi:hypothetical protein
MKQIQDTNFTSSKLHLIRKTQEGICTKVTFHPIIGHEGLLGKVEA